MKINNCFWETALNSTTCEVQIEETDLFDANKFMQLEKDFQYIVVKAPMNMIEFNYGLAKMGYITCEVQCRISITYSDFDFYNPLVKRIYPYTEFKNITSASDINLLLNNITPNMFSTDRITLDPYFGKETGCKRYKNWITYAFENNQMNFLWFIYKGEKVGFSMYKENAETTEGVLGGLFTQYQAKGLGIITATRHLLHAKKNSMNMKKYITCISSNNQAVLRIYNRLNFQIEKMQYVFIKHTNNTNL